MKVDCDELFYCGYVKEAEDERDSLQSQLNTVSKLNDRNYAELLKARERIAELEALPTTTVIGCYCLKLSPAGRPCAICIKAKHDKYKTALEEIVAYLGGRGLLFITEKYVMDIAKSVLPISPECNNESNKEN